MSQRESDHLSRGSDVRNKEEEADTPISTSTLVPNNLQARPEHLIEMGPWHVDKLFITKCMVVRSGSRDTLGKVRRERRDGWRCEQGNCQLEVEMCAVWPHLSLVQITLVCPLIPL